MIFDICLYYFIKEDDADYEDTDDIEDCQRRAELRKRFNKAAKETEGLEIREKDMVDKVYVLIHCPFSRMCHQAESVNLEMPLEGVSGKRKILEVGIR